MESRVEILLSKIADGDGTPETPKSRVEELLTKIINDDDNFGSPKSRVEELLVDLGEKITSGDKYTEYDLVWILDNYISDTDGSVNPETGSSCSDYCEIGNFTKLSFTNTMTEDNQYNVFYDSEKNFISAFSNATGTVVVPEDASYFRLSKYTSATLTVSGIDPLKAIVNTALNSINGESNV